MKLEELNRSLLNSALLNSCEYGGVLWAGPDFILDSSSGLDKEQSDILRGFRTRLARVLPDDWTYELSLDGKQITFSLNYEDGFNAGAFGVNKKFFTEDELLACLNATDWDAERAAVLQMTNLQDEMAERGKALPVQIPSVKTLRKTVKTELRDFHKEMRKLKPKYSLFMLENTETGSDEDLELVAYVDFQTEEDVIGHLVDSMTFRNFVISYCIDGKPLPSAEVEELKQKVLNSLGPISRSKAEGRFGAMEMEVF